jgi:hypothetical protein
MAAKNNETIDDCHRFSLDQDEAPRRSATLGRAKRGAAALAGLLRGIIDEWKNPILGLIQFVFAFTATRSFHLDNCQGVRRWSTLEAGRGGRECG